MPEEQRELFEGTVDTKNQGSTNLPPPTRSNGLFSDGFPGLLNKGPIGWIIFGLAAGILYGMYESLQKWGGDQPQMSRTTLEAAADINGYPCAKGDVWFFTDRQLARCFLSRDALFGEVIAPSGSLIVLRPDGTRGLGLSRDTPIYGYYCRGGGLPGPAEGYTTEFYPSGRLELCWLAGDQEVQGVPCAGASFSHAVSGADDGTYFDENRKLKQCKLSKDFGSQQRGQHFVQSP